MRKKWLISIGMLILAIFIGGCKLGEPKPEDVFNTYIDHWQNHKFAEMYDMHTKTANEFYTKKEFAERLEKIYTDLEVTNLKVTFNEDNVQVDEDSEKAMIPFSVSMDTIAGPVKFKREAELIKIDKDEEVDWQINWDHGFIFEGMEPEDRVSLEITRAARGEIKDRKGKGLAVNGDALEVGVIPEKMIENEQAVKSELARLLNITVDDIDQALNASWVKPNYFVPIKRIPHTESGLMEKLQQLPGVQINKVSGRVYPLGEAAAHLIGYVDEVTAEDLEKNKKYRPGDMIGKRGLEQLFEERLQGDHGVTISLEKPDGTKTTVVQKPVKNGEDIQLTIDSSFQQEIMKKFNGKEGTAIALHPKTGETLAIVSSPAFNPNTFMYMTAKERKNLEENPAEPLVNRFVYPHTPGSVMKPFTAAIGLENGTITPKMAKEITGTKWQKDKTWGGYYVTRVSNPGHPINLEDALVLSDNIYFAQTALDMGADQYIKGLTKFGFGEEIPYIYPLKPSQISNDGKFKNDILLADSSYGQGEVQTNIVHLAAGYTAFINDGNIIKPILLTEEKKGQIWKEAVIEKNTAKIINDSLRQVVASPRGTAHSVNMEDLPLAGKTGTAEIAKSGQGKQGIENGWFVAYNADSHDLLIALTMEEVQGQGKITSQAVKELFEFYKAN